MKRFVTANSVMVVFSCRVLPLVVFKSTGNGRHRPAEARTACATVCCANSTRKRAQGLLNLCVASRILNVMVILAGGDRCRKVAHTFNNQLGTLQ